MQFVNEQRRIGKFIMGIGHRVKSVLVFLFFSFFPIVVPFLFYKVDFL